MNELTHMFIVDFVLHEDNFNFYYIIMKMNWYASTLTKTTHAFHTYFHKAEISASWCSTSVNTYLKLL